MHDNVSELVETDGSLPVLHYLVQKRVYTLARDEAEDNILAAHQQTELLHIKSTSITTTRTPMESTDLPRCRSDREGCDAPPRCIESLPAEIQRHIMLFLPSLGSLGAVIRASPVLYSLFRHEPKNYIVNCLINVLGDSFIDAITARAAMQESFQHLRCIAMKEGHETRIIWPFLEAYQGSLQRLSYKRWIRSLSLSEAVEMATFQTSTVEPLVEEYSSWALANLGVPATTTGLSKNERMRIQRALYRFQIVCDVFGNKLKDNYLSNHRPRHLGCIRFLSSYEPWEIEEILCINAFFQDQYKTRLEEVSEDLSTIIWRSAGEPGETVDAMGAHTRQSSRNFLVSQGLPLLTSVLRIRDRGELAATLRANVDHHAGHIWLDDVTGNMDMHERWERSYSERDLAQDEGRPIPFRGDDTGSPPLAWVLIWGETYSNLFGTFIPKPLRRWGYIMWDAWRLDETGARERLMREWHDMWQGGDYGDSLRAWSNAWNNRG
ncbi:hypothetical protein DHEL01_v209986 [Diaporthe helianthi]|uniref:F-box domain-containing protein n=1 Tax=Diaporthe helianthi TaxID=158607 RepID=A0A2P5HN00_DIAHE|nr:hypothetical protein DHEL01_v209986 [Diaporthe helianthi]